MKKKTWLIIAAICILLVLAVAIIFVNRPTPQDEMMDILNRMENALGDEWEKQSVTEVSNIAYSDEEGNTIIYHVCVTKYYGVDAAKQTGLNTDAISAVISPDEAESWRECTVSDLPAAIYQKDGRAYLCWTIMPEFSCVIEYGSYCRKRRRHAPHGGKCSCKPKPNKQSVMYNLQLHCRNHKFCF